MTGSEVQNRRTAALACAFLLGVSLMATPAVSAPVTSAAGRLMSGVPAPIDPWLDRTLRERAEVEFFVILEQRSDLGSVAAGAGNAARVKRTAAVRDALREHAEHTQAPLRAWLEARGIPYRSFHIVNALLVRGNAGLARSLAQRADVVRIEGNPVVAMPRPTREEQLDVATKALAAVEPGVSVSNAPAIWAKGFTGQGIVVGGQDTGVSWTHPALKSRYLGWNGTSADHNYHWHDAIHAQVNPGTPVNSCGYNTAQPCDDNDHGTHTMGTAVGSDGGANQIGMAPGARWIACRNMDEGFGSPATYLECFEWFLAPYPIGATSAQGDPSRAPHVTINSWGCPPAEGCSALTLSQAVAAQRAAGIMTVVSAGNAGPSCSTVDDPPAIYDASYTVGAYIAGTSMLAPFSSRGPVTVDGSGRAKPDIAAPGVSVRSSIGASSYAAFNGTSMAGPHVAGAVALLWSALPHLKGDIAATENALNAGAQKVSLGTAECGSSGTPNALWGHGKLDTLGSYNIVNSVLSVTRSGTGTGTVASNPAGIACGATCSASFAPGTPVALTATPGAGSVFAGWLGACTGSGPCNIASGAGAASATFAPSAMTPLRIDIDGDNDYDALTDGLMILRYLFGLAPATIADGAIGATASVSDPAQLTLRLQNLKPLMDIDGDGRADALSDGVMVLRYLFGLRGPPLIADAIGPGATRATPALVEAYLASILVKPVP